MESSEIKDKVSRLVEDLITSYKLIHNKLSDRPDEQAIYMSYITRLSDQSTCLVLERVVSGAYAKVLSNVDGVLTNDIKAELRLLSILIHVIPDVCLIIMKCMPDPPDSVKRMCDSHKLWKPISMSFNVDPVLVKPINTGYRYMYNLTSTKLKLFYMDKSTLSLTDAACAKMFFAMACQSRWGGFWRQVISSFLFCDQVSEANALRNTNFDNLLTKTRIPSDYITLQTICYLMKRFSFLPWYTNRRAMIFINKWETVEWVSSLVPLIYSLLELGKEERMCSMRISDLIYALKLRITASYTSLESVMLEEKSKYTAVQKYITMAMSNYVRIHHNGSVSAHRLSSVPEFLLDTEQHFKDLKLANVGDPDLFNWLISNIKYVKMSDPNKNTESARYLLSVLENLGNSGIYYRTSLTLEAVKSIEPQQHNLPKLPQPTAYYEFDQVSIPLSYDWNAFPWNVIKELYYKRLSKIKQELAQYQPESFFVSILTNNSQGIKADLAIYTDTSAGPSDERLKILGGVSQSRLANFLLDQTKFSSLYSFVSSLHDAGKCTTRSQNNRRARIVEIVTNSDQVGYAPTYFAFNEVKVLYEDMAVGKQSGGIHDMLLQLETTGDDLSLSIFSDVSAMDASTDPFIACMFGLLLCEYLEQHHLDKDRYFAFTRNNFNVTLANGATEGRSVGAINQAVRLITSLRAGKKYTLKDPIFAKEIQVNTSLFESGRYDTSAQHTTLLSLIAEITQNANRPAIYNFTNRKFGDDSYERLRFTSDNNLSGFVDDYVKRTASHLLMLGFKIEGEASRLMGDFLQQKSFCGAYLAKSQRSSIYCDERQDTLKRSVFDQIGILRNVSYAAAQRGYAPENLMPIVHAAWIAMRTVKVGRMDVSSLWKNHYYSPYFVPPFEYTYFSGVSATTVTQQSGDVILPRCSNLTPLGTGKKVYVLNHLLSDEEKLLLTTTNSGPYEYGEIKMHAPWDALKPKLEALEMLPGIILSYFSATASIQKSRESIVKDDIPILTGVLSKYYDYHRMERSKAAVNELHRATGLMVPDSITYAGQPLTKVKTLFNELPPNSDESIIAVRSLIRYIEKIKVVPDKIMRDFNAAGFLFEETSFAWPRVDNLHSYPLVSGYRQGSDWSNFYALVGSPLNSEGRIGRAASTLVTRYSGRFNVQMALDYGIRIASLGKPHLLTKYIDSLVISGRAAADLLVAIRNLDSNSINDVYVSGFQPDIFFGISGDSVPFKHNVQLEPDMNRFSSLLSVVARDYYMYNAHMHHFSKFKLKTATMTKVSMVSKRYSARIALLNTQKRNAHNAAMSNVATDAYD